MSRKKLLSELKKTIQFHEKLNPDIWDGEKLKPEIHLALLKIARDFTDYLEIPKDSVIDIIFLGGNANYNYTDSSDIDLHLVLDPDKIKDCDDYIENYLIIAKELYNKNHDIFIKGKEVELYAELPAQSRKKHQGVYSIKQSKWLQKPLAVRPDVDDDDILRKARVIAKEIDHLTDGTNDSISSIVKLKDKLKRMRTVGLLRAGEFSPENLIYKILRDNGKIQQLFDRYNQLRDDDLSLE